MNEVVFSAASLAAVVAWAGLGMAVLVPIGRLRAALLVFGGRVVPVGLSLLYTYLLITHWGSAPGGGFSSLAAVQALFSASGKMLGGWVHFLAFDLLAGRWLVDDALASRRSRLILLIPLPVTFMYGPLGFVLYVLARSAPLFAPRGEVRKARLPGC